VFLATGYLLIGAGYLAKHDREPVSAAMSGVLAVTADVRAVRSSRERESVTNHSTPV
jgi:hypothetical protein